MKKVTNNLLKKYKSSMLIHFIIGGWGTSASLFFGWMLGVLFSVLAIIILYIKEKYIDNVFNVKDYRAGILGCVASWAIYALSILCVNYSQIILPLVIVSVITIVCVNIIKRVK